MGMKNRIYKSSYSTCSDTTRRAIWNDINIARISSIVLYLSTHGKK